MSDDSFISPAVRERVRGSAEPVARLLGRVGLTPNALTVIGFAIAVAAGCAAAVDAWILAGSLVLFGALFDLLDGALARATNTASRLGAFLDSVFDRAGEAVVYLGIALAFGDARLAMAPVPAGAAVPMAAMAAAFMVSYTRAKAESLGFAAGRGLANVGFAPREVRIVILGGGLVLTGVRGGIGEGTFPADGVIWLSLSLCLIVILATVTTIQRIVHVYRQSRKEQ